MIMQRQQQHLWQDHSVSKSGNLNKLRSVLTTAVNNSAGGEYGIVASKQCGRVSLNDRV